ncbi:MAG: HEAT repeat domain-containing protein [Methanoregula sp.]|jgi:HEAT repeat protein|uniref:HEAT repeat domain-containing protein n=1 Tax=Methanoregula sp. TaxID=2052170 RepID=UPI0025E5CBFF|nr:HEAT repeat domain-containing protein [Methanoregula sp.]MCK9630176.1 HEAT repeat domain-containing protein [Methanoregula sp.]
MTNDNPTEQNVPEKPENAGELEKLGLEGLVKALQDSTDPQVRQYAAYLLGKAQNPRAIQPLIEALADFDKSVREQATLALSRIGKAAIEPLAEAMKEPKWETRYRAAEALGKIADEKAVKPLIQGLKDNRDHVRYMAAKGLKGLGDSDAIEPMVILLKDENRYVRMMAVRALGAIGGKNVSAALNSALAAEQDEKVKEAIVEALK